MIIALDTIVNWKRKIQIKDISVVTLAMKGTGMTMSILVICISYLTFSYVSGKLNGKGDMFLCQSLVLSYVMVRWVWIPAPDSSIGRALWLEIQRFESQSGVSLFLQSCNIWCCANPWNLQVNSCQEKA